MKLKNTLKTVADEADNAGLSLANAQQVSAQKQSLISGDSIAPIRQRVGDIKVIVDNIIDRGYELFPNMDKAKTIEEVKLGAATKLQTKISMDYLGMEIASTKDVGYVAVKPGEAAPRSAEPSGPAASSGAGRAGGR